MINETFDVPDVSALQELVGLTQAQAGRIRAIWNAKSQKELEHLEPELQEEFYLETVNPERNSLVANKIQLIMWVGNFHSLDATRSTPDAFYCVHGESSRRAAESTIVFSGGKLAIVPLSDLKGRREE